MTQEQTATPAIKMFRYKNISGVALTIPEHNILVPKDGYSAPMTESTPTCEAYVAGKLFTKEDLTINEIAGADIKGVAQGGAVTEIDTTGSAKPVIAAPETNKPTAAPAIAKPDYIPFKQSSPSEKIHAYDRSAEVAKAIENTVISIGPDVQGMNQFGEIPQDEAAKLLRSAGHGNFSVEVSTGQYVADEAQKIIASASGVVSTPPSASYPIPEGVPADVAPFFKQTGLQKKIFIYKTSNAEVLLKVKPFEKDPNVLSCIDQRLTELEKA